MCSTRSRALLSRSGGAQCMLEFFSPLVLVAFPVLGALVVATLSREPRAARLSAMAVMLAMLLLSLRIFIAFDGASGHDAFDFNVPWMPSLGVNLHFGVDGFNIYLVLLAALLFPVALGCTWNTAEAKRPLYLSLLLLLEGSLLGTFLSQNLVLFFVFWEAVLIPMGVLILVFGGARRREAAFGFFLYTLAGSVLLLAAVIALGAESLQQTGRWSFELDVIYRLHLDWGMQVFVFTAIMLACAVKCPLVPFHSWLPLAYYEAPAAATALMAGALSKMGAFGILKFAIPLAPDVAAAAAPWIAVLALVSILYGAVLALRQPDFKMLVAYSSLSHMGYIVLGLFTLQQAGIHGAMLQMLSHGLAVAGLFLLLGILEQRCHGRYLRVNAVATVAPRFAVVLMLFILTSLALPLTSGFTAEFLILFGAFARGLAAWDAGAGSAMLVVALLASTGVVLGAAYMLRLARSVLFRTDGDRTTFADLRVGEIAPLVVPLVLVLWIGVAPMSFISRVQGVLSRLPAPAT